MRSLLLSRHLTRGCVEVRSSFLSTEAAASLAAAVDGSAPATATLDPAAIDAYRRKHMINMRGRGLAEFNPFTSFDAANFHKNIMKVIQKENYTEPTPIQAQSWPLSMKGRDMISVARTGSGKTCAFLLPAIQKMLSTKSLAELKKEEEESNSAQEGDPFANMSEKEIRRSQRRERRMAAVAPPRVLILAPTRELCVQIGDEARKYGNACGIKSATIYGGASKGPQIRDIQDGAGIIIATPGRCNDLVNMGLLDLSMVDYFVLDEADRMLDMGFEPQISEIVTRLPPGPKRQTLFFSATWPVEVQGMAAEYLSNPVLIQIGIQNELNANKAIKQTVRVLREADKIDELLDTLESLSDSPKEVPKTIVFRNKKFDCDETVRLLREEGYAAESLHGDKSQNERDRVMENYRQGRIRVLVATDVASRGLDIKDISVVVNYDFPNDVEDYVHRIGRTGRADRTGEAFTFFTVMDKSKANGLLELLERSGQPVPNELRTMFASASRSAPSKSRFRQAGQPITRTNSYLDKFGAGGRSSSFGFGPSSASHLPNNQYASKQPQQQYQQHQQPQQNRRPERKSRNYDFDDDDDAPRRSRSSRSSRRYDSDSDDDF